MPKGKRHGSITGRAVRVYEALRREGMGKTKAAKIANAHKSGTLNRGGKRGKRR